MRKLNLCLIIFVLFSLFISCKKDAGFSQLTYNEKANELILQIIKDNSCGCILEIPQESMIKMSIMENPHFDIRQGIIRKLRLKNTNQLDSLEKVSENFILNTILFKKKNITIIKQDSISNIFKDGGPDLLKKCPNSVLYFSKPILDERNKTAIINYDLAFTCISTPLNIYNYKNGKWVSDNK